MKFRLSTVTSQKVPLVLIGFSTQTSLTIIKNVVLEGNHIISDALYTYE
jgi:hypothetical protein